ADQHEGNRTDRNAQPLLGWSTDGHHRDSHIEPEAPQGLTILTRCAVAPARRSAQRVLRDVDERATTKAVARARHASSSAGASSRHSGSGSARGSAGRTWTHT